LPTAYFVGVPQRIFGIVIDPVLSPALQRLAAETLERTPLTSARARRDGERVPDAVDGYRRALDAVT